MPYKLEGRSKSPAPRFSFTNKLSASNKIPRQINRNLIFNQVRTRQPISRADLARVSGLQRSTVSLIVEELLAEHWIVEGSMGRLPRGRRPTFLNVNSQRSVLALDIHPSQTTLAVTDLTGKIVSQDLIPLPDDPEKVISAIVTAIQHIIAANKDRSFNGVGISLPGRLDLTPAKSAAGRRRTSKPIFAPNVRWPIAHITSSVEQATGLPVVADNVANACALSEVWFGDSDGMHDLVVVNVSEGLGTGIFANGRILRGEGGSAGEFGHVQMDPHGLPCGCGSTGCWETLAANPAGMRYYTELANKQSPAFEELLQLADAGDAAAKRAIDRMCAALGRGMHMIASALAPSEIVVVGDITTLWHIAGPLIETEMRRHPLASVPHLRPAQDGNKARLRSAVALVMHDTLL
ncbi:MAG TPA: ROK family protein [Terracidiphilus sp.]|jgi:predicted NBD/HSP70 family sugar kinase